MAINALNFEVTGIDPWPELVVVKQLLFSFLFAHTIPSGCLFDGKVWLGHLMKRKATSACNEVPCN